VLQCVNLYTRDGATGGSDNISSISELTDMEKLTRIAELTQSLDVFETGVWLDWSSQVSGTNPLFTEVIRLRERLQQSLHARPRVSFYSAKAR